MTLKTVFLYQVGRAEAVREVAGNQASLWIGAGLTVTAAAARRYDQTSILDAPWWPVVPLVFSLFSSLFVYFLVYPLLLRSRSDPKESWPGFWRQYRVFLGLFWMTSPLAWLYAIPVERFLPPREAAIGNMTLLGIVSIWRVWLLSRALAVLTGQRFARVCCVVLLAGCLEMIGVGLAASLSVLEVMGGLTHSPEAVVRQSGNGFAIIGAMILGLGALVAWICWEPSVQERPLPVPTQSKVSWTGLTALWLLWAAVAVIPQLELARTRQVRTLVEAGRYPEALAYLSRHAPKDFCPAQRIPPDPYRYGVFKSLPGLLEAMDGREAPWVRAEYLSHLEIALNHRMVWIDPEDGLKILDGLEKIPEGSGWQSRHSSKLKKLGTSWRAEQADAHRELTNRLARLKI